MSSNYLLSYSIMNHKSHELKMQPISLPPLSPIIKQLNLDVNSHHQLHHFGVGASQFSGKYHGVVLPPLNNYTTSSIHSTSRTGSSTPESSLTEHNLLNLDKSGLGLLSSTIANLHCEKRESHSLTSGSSVSSASPMSSPHMENATTHEHPVAPSSAMAATNLTKSTSTKRRQRLGPSCDSCRSRKVKCNADISIVLKSLVDPSELSKTGMTPSQINDLLQNQAQISFKDADDTTVYFLISNEKVIKLRSCKSCSVKGFNCCFSKGFTKEDIMMNNKKSDVPMVVETHIVESPKRVKPAKIVKKKVVKPYIEPKKSTLFSLTSALTKNLAEDKEDAANSSRKSSCISCRKRKVKCVFNSELNKCEGCHKKSHDCVFENKQK